MQIKFPYFGVHIYHVTMQVNNTYWLMYSVLMMYANGVHVPHSEWHTYFDWAFCAWITTHRLHFTAKSTGRPVDEGFIHRELTSLPTPYSDVFVRHVSRLVLYFLKIHDIIPEEQKWSLELIRKLIYVFLIEHYIIWRMLFISSRIPQYRLTMTMNEFFNLKALT